VLHVTLTLVRVMLYWMVLITTSIRRLPSEISVKTRSAYQVIFFNIWENKKKEQRSSAARSE